MSIATVTRPTGPATLPPRRTLGLPTKEERRDLEAAKSVLEGWLRARLPERPGLRVTAISMPESGGIANETLLLDAEWDAAATRRQIGFVARVETRDGLYPATDFANQYRANAIFAGEADIPAAPVIGLEEDRSVLGDAFYVMERLPGRACSDQPPFHGSGWVFDTPAQDRGRMWRAAIACMARVQQVDPARFPFLERPGRGRTGWEQEFDYYCDYRDWALLGERNRIIDQALDWLRANKPAETPTGLSWGDARFGNLLFEGSALTGIVDWDMVSLAGAESDLAWWIVSDLNATHACGLPRLEGFGTPRETIALWEELSGRRARDLDFHLVFAAFRIGIIVVRLAASLHRRGMLPPESEYLMTNNRGIQYLTTMLDLDPVGTITIPWPGLDR